MTAHAAERRHLAGQTLVPRYGYPPRLRLSWAARRHWVTLLLPVIVLVGAAIVAGLARSPNYSADTRLAAGKIDAGTPTSTLAGFTAATQTLAQTYSRMVPGDAVLNRVASQLNTTPSAIRPGLSAAPIPQTPVFRVTGSASSPERAVQLSVLASQALVRELRRQSTTTGGSGKVFADYRAAAQEKSVARDQVTQDRQVGASHSVLANDTANLELASLRADSLRQRYLEGSQNQTGTAQPQIIERASGATSDRASILQILVFAGAVVGLLVGLALAWARANREARRLLAS